MLDVMSVENTTLGVPGSTVEFEPAHPERSRAKAQRRRKMRFIARMLA
jgi:hypothetical protein